MPTNELPRIPILLFTDMETDIRLFGGSVRVRIVCRPTDKHAAPEYEVTVYQRDLPSPPTDAYSDYALDLMSLGLQSGSPYGRGEKSGTLRITKVDKGVELGRINGGAWNWVAAESCAARNRKPANPLSCEIEPCEDPDGAKIVFIRSTEPQFKLHITPLDAYRKHATHWGSARVFTTGAKVVAAFKKNKDFPPDGTNVPPPVPPGSSNEGDDKR